MIRLFWHGRAFAAVVLAVVMVVAFSITNPGFTEPGNVSTVLVASTTLALVASGLAVLMMAGQFDLSVAGTVPLAAIATVKLAPTLGNIGALVAAVAIVVALGVLSGVITVRFGVSSLAVTVGTLVLATGLGFALSAGKVVVLTDFRASAWLNQPLGSVLTPYILIQAVALVVLLLLTVCSRFGLSVRALGSDPDRARAMGVSGSAVTITAFALAGTCAGLAGALQGLSLGAGPTGQNQSLLLQAATAAILGGVALGGGVGKLYGVLSAALFLSALESGLSLQGTDAAIAQLVSGLVLLAVVVMDRPLGTIFDRSLQSGRAVRPSAASGTSQGEAR